MMLGKAQLRRLACAGCMASMAIGCGPDLLYLPALAGGQIEVALKSVPIEQAIADSTLTSEQVDKLELIVDVREYARTQMGLHVGSSFSLFFDSGDTTRIFNVSASQRDRLEPVTWSFPLVGTLPYIGFFDEQLAKNERRMLDGQDLDTWIYEVSAYSTLGFLPNPVRSAMLYRDDRDIIDTVVHELLHNTVWRQNDATFNESLATYVGRTGTLEYLQARYPDEPQRVEQALAEYEDIDTFNAFFFQLYSDLAAYYAGNGDRREKTAGRESVFETGRTRFFEEVQPTMNEPEAYNWVEFLPTNNAWMLANYRYNLDLGLFDEVYRASGENWAAAIGVYQAAAATNDPKGYLRSWLEMMAGLDASGKTLGSGPPTFLMKTIDDGAPAVERRGLCARPIHSHP